MDKISTEIIHKEIDLIQACITRMANNSFLLKGWYITLITVMLTLFFAQHCRIELIGLFIFVITAVFWGLDGFFLKTEILYRWKYSWVIKERLKDNQDNLYDLDPYNKDMWIDANSKNDCLFNFILSKTLILLYGMPMLISIVILVHRIIY
ncbi:hypothetical protein D4Z93_09860 [Clostridium fermenticellae]|uniref:Uncharacterized protein n=1 Tax=Clostridium fermenticellae TaxID=2068654 RepID=A0A386H5C4_9CLOT|nr:hypothetical protein [Clostridium fermenticellae]AYD40814.1 hypothetical protein D4Z93_09860 [Clostridium fermenticellae]